VTTPTTVLPDTDSAQTAAAVENTLIAAYRRLTALPYVQDLGLGVFWVEAAEHHAAHLAAFNAASARLGGRPQSGVDQPFMTSVVEPGLAKLTSGLDAVMFSARLEMIAAATYTSQVATVADPQLRASLASVAGVECQHQGVLYVVASLLSAGAATVQGFPVAPQQLPPTLQGPPLAFVRADQARPAGEGAVH
jgi:hypothetical protein